VAKSGRSPLILVVDDDEGLLILIAEAFRDEGCEVLTANSGAAALASLQKRKPDLMLLDLKMKDVGGQALIARMKEQRSLVPFVVVTGQGDERVAVEVMKQGALDYVMKDTGLLDRLPLVVRRALEVLDRNRALSSAEEERRRLEKEILEISEREQQRIGEDLHDGLGQQLTAIEMLCAGLKSDIAAQPKFARQVERIAHSIRETITFVRLVARGLAPESDDPDALQVSLIALVELTNSLGAVKCRLECPRPVLLADPSKAVPLYRIAQEAVNNALKHSGGTEVVVRLMQNEEVLKLQVSDNGTGLRKSKGDGMGLHVMKHRASSIGAQLTVEAKPSRGVSITCVLPGSP
jgi:signal transduction histidine kinase